jgi:ABC-type multidrug transport system fused ATPase/permease subunit
LGRCLAVQSEDVVFNYVPGSKILCQNTFEVKPGANIGICGPAGAGKSTLIKILTRYYDIDSGTIRDSNKIMVVNGGEIVEYTPHYELMAAKGFYYTLYRSQFKGKAPGGMEVSNIDFIST